MAHAKSSGGANASAPAAPSQSPPPAHGCRLVAILDRVQGGLIGQTLSKFGIAGLYTVFVYGIGRFLRLSMTNIRMRIPYEDLPNTRRLVALCQVRRGAGALCAGELPAW
jgi:piezo-type mechanosensitive ion channel component 1/2